MRSWRPLGLVPLQHDRVQLVERHIEGGVGEDGRQSLGLEPYRDGTDIQLPYQSFSTPRAEPSPPALLRRGGSLASAAVHIGIVALLLPVGQVIQSSFFGQHMVYLIPLGRPAPVEIEAHGGTSTSRAPAGGGAIAPGALAGSRVLTPEAPTGVSAITRGAPAASAVGDQPTNGPPAKGANPVDATPNVALVRTLELTRPLRTETARPLRTETALTAIEVEHAVVRDPKSAAPEFPARLLAAGTAGEVTARFVVDTLGVVDMASYTVVRSTRGEFSDAVLRALPRMRFRPATQRGRLVRQWVEQTFYFRVQRNETALTKNQVDNPVERDPTSPEPEFPKQLLAAGIAGQVTARFVVDTMGVVDMASYTVIQYSRSEFEDAVRGALPGMRFTPATQGGRLVRQWVEQTFHFRVQRKPE